MQDVVVGQKRNNQTRWLRQVSQGSYYIPNNTVYREYFASKSFVKVGGCASSSIPPSSPSLAVWKKWNQWQKARREIWTWVVLSLVTFSSCSSEPWGHPRPHAYDTQNTHISPERFCWFLLCFAASWYPFWVHGLLVAKLKFLTVVFRIR